MQDISLSECACFGVAGNFTGHLEQAGEAKDFKGIKTGKNEPKALFPTYIPSKKDDGCVPEYLKIFPFDSEKIVFPLRESNIQLEAECALIFNVEWQNKKVSNIFPICFASSNDVSIRKEGAKKISEKKNWGKSSKGLSANLIPIDSFDENGILNRYRIASFIVRYDKVLVYGEDSAVRNYTYIYQKLSEWIIEKLNYQKNEGPAEEISLYLQEADFPQKIMVSIGATRYTDFGEHNFLISGDKSVVVLYPEDKYSFNDISLLVKNNDFSDKEISFLVQKVIL